MHDWIAVVRENLNELDLPAEQEQAVVTEMAAHLEDLYEDYLRKGLSDAEAFQCSLEQATGLRTTRRKIRRAKCKEGLMNSRTKTLWLPGLATLSAASISLMLLQQFAYLHPEVWQKDGGALVVDLPWLLLLPLCGALGAYLSQRARGQRIASLVAGLFPSIIMFAVFCVLIPVGVLVERNQFIIHHPTYFMLALVNWMVIPALLLFLGVVVVWLRSADREALPSRAS
jgi:hypothetical protein